MPNAISACKASSISPECNPGSPPQRGYTPCKGSSQMRPRQRPSKPPRGGTQRHRAGVRSDSAGSTSESADPAKSRAPRSPLLHPQFTPNTQRSAESCPYRA
jgi:hypothetical protein